MDWAAALRLAWPRGRKPALCCRVSQLFTPTVHPEGCERQVAGQGCLAEHATSPRPPPATTPGSRPQDTLFRGRFSLNVPARMVEYR